ncbi:hypothetical protein BGX38DRAFT_1274306 [Terfezia claveryi]|nr:hypothetical protein BGX38DRAFT_1274306 [Terfezia claveryi]
MSAISIELSEQLREFSNDNKIITQDGIYVPIYFWHFGNHLYKLSGGVENRLVNAIVAKWEQEGIKDMEDFESKLGMTPEAVITMVRELVDTDLQAFFGLNDEDRE